jgi:hypothetical protein
MSTKLSKRKSMNVESIGNLKFPIRNPPIGGSLEMSIYELGIVPYAHLPDGSYRVPTMTTNDKTLFFQGNLSTKHDTP